jgi:two-component system NtrC family sensor kinase
MDEFQGNTTKFKPDIIFDDSGPIDENTQRLKVAESGNALAEMEAALDEIAGANPRIEQDEVTATKSLDDLRGLLHVSQAVNSSLVLEDILQVVMKKAIELLSAERGFIMLLDDTNRLQFKTAFNLCKEALMDEDFKISNSIADQVAGTGKSVYTSDAQSDERYAGQKSVRELHLRSIMCVPLKIKNSVIGIIYLDNSSQAKLFLKSDLFLFELFAQQAANAIHNAGLYDHVLALKKYNETVVNNSPVGIVVIDSTYNVISINDAALATLEKNKDDITAYHPRIAPTKFLNLIPESERPKWRQMIDVALTTNQSYEDARYFHNTGYEEKVLSIKISPTTEIPYGGDGLILIIEDITEKIIMEKYVILSEKLVARGEMAASIGHELNNYLTIIANNAELLSLNIDKGSSDKARRNTVQIIESIKKMKRFTDGLMDFSKLETEVISYDLKLLIEDLLFSIKPQARFKQVDFTFDLDTEMPPIEIDVGQIQQVLMNLLNNAADATDDRAETEGKDSGYKHHIDISTSYDRKKDRVEITVADNGCGIPEEGLSKIFTPHYTTKDSGHGLGLANCRKIIESHQGEITVQSKVGQGTSFTITLPREHKKIE